MRTTGGTGAKRVRPKPRYAVPQRVDELLRKFDYPEFVPAAAPFIPGGGGGMMTVTVAAVNATDLSKSKADYQCLGADDHLTVQQAVDDIAAVGGIVWLSEGDFEFTWRNNGNTCVDSNLGPTSILGMGIQATVINVNGEPSAVDQPVFSASFQGVTFGGFYVVDNQSGTVPTVGLNMGNSYGRVENYSDFTFGPSIDMSGFGNVITETVLDGSEGVGIRMNGGFNNVIDGVTIYADTWGIQAFGTQDAVITNCYIDAQNGIELQDLNEGLMVSNNDFFVDDAVIQLTDGTGYLEECIISDNRMNTFDGPMIDLTSTTGSLWNTITGNMMIGGGDGIILNDDWQSITITGNLFQFLDSGVLGSWNAEANGGSAISANTFAFCGVGISLVGGGFGNGTDIGGNTFQNCEVGVLLDDIDAVTITGNNFVWSLFQGIDATANCDDILVSGNMFWRCGSGSNNTYDAIRLTATCDRWFITGNLFRPWATNKTRYGVNIAAASCDNNRVVGNDFGANSGYGTGSINNAGTGTLLVWPNDATYGDNFVT